MSTDEAIKFFGGVKQLARFLNRWPQSVYTWKERPPMSIQYELEVRTLAALAADKDGSKIRLNPNQTGVEWARGEADKR